MAGVAVCRLNAEPGLAVFRVAGSERADTSGRDTRALHARMNVKHDTNKMTP